jgi:hypothetical protein
VACARTGLDGSAHDPALPRDLDWDRLHAAAGRHGIVPLLFRHLRTLPRGTVPDLVLDRLRFAAFGIGRRNVELAAEMGRVQRLLDKAGVRALPYKGPVLAVEAYGDLSMRKFEDLDFLVPPSELPQALSAMQAAGFQLHPRLTPAREREFYRSECECWLANADDTVTVEIHWAVRERLYDYPMDPAELAARATPLRVAGATVPCLAPEDLLLVLTVHGFKHGWHQLKWLRDVAGLLQAHPELDWTRLTSEARRLRGEELLLLMLLLSARLLGSPLPEELRERAERTVGTAADVVVRQMVDLEGEEPPEIACHRLYLQVRKDPRARLRFLGGMIFTPTLADWEALSLPDALFPLYRLYRPLRLLGKYRRRGEAEDNEP